VEFREIQAFILEMLCDSFGFTVSAHDPRACYYLATEQSIATHASKVCNPRLLVMDFLRSISHHAAAVRVGGNCIVT